jgi:hypothetical protein
MVKSFTRIFPIKAAPSSLMELASLPLLGPHYLNFLQRIEKTDDQGSKHGWTSYKVWVVYKSILKTQGVVEHLAEGALQKVTLRHDGGIAMFVSTFQIEADEVQLTCTYDAKIPLVQWLVARVLDRALTQVASAMDRYAATRAWGPQ